MLAKQPLVLCILDGWGVNPSPAHNGIYLANTPNWDALLQTSPHTSLQASEEFVGLPEGQMGNSEVGHMTIGAGRVIMQDLPALNHMIAHKTFEKKESIQNLIGSLKSNGKACHVMGLLSDGGVHSHINHLLHTIEILGIQNIPVNIHAFLDGRDTSPQSAITYLEKLTQLTSTYPHVKLATIGGRYYAMDRDQRWDRIELAYNTMIFGSNDSTNQTFTSAIDSINDSYRQGIYDEFIIPQPHENYQGMNDGDGLIMINFRADRARQILRCLLKQDFADFTRKKTITFSHAIGFNQYAEDLNAIMDTIIKKPDMQNTLGEYISKLGGHQLRIAETEKYAHVTFFFNGGVEKPFDNEDRILIPSPKVATYDLQPEMSAKELTDILCEKIDQKKYDLIVVNYANTDMVGHTGVQSAIIKAIEAVDSCLGKLATHVKRNDYQMIITADHGNAELMMDTDSNQPHTAHTLMPVPFVLYNNKTHTPPIQSEYFLKTGHLGNIAPTVLKLMGLDIPKQMDEPALV